MIISYSIRLIPRDVIDLMASKSTYVDDRLGYRGNQTRTSWPCQWASPPI